MMTNPAAKILSVAFAIPALFGCTAGPNEAFSPVAPTYDIAIVNGRVIDPETGLDAIRNVGILGDKIVIVSENPIIGRSTIDATDKIVAPGFIDMHVHGQRILEGRVQALDGVTTALELEGGMLPVAAFYDKAAKEGRPIHYGISVNWAFARIAAKTGLEPIPEPEFFFSNFGDRSWQEDLATQDELDQILMRVRRGLDEGGLGIGFMLGYAPGTGRKEYYLVSKLAAEYGVPTFTHVRYRSNSEPKSTFEAFQELISVAASTGAQMHIAHLNSSSIRDIDDTAQLVLGAQKNGLPITVEAYPFGSGSTAIGAAMFRGENWQERQGGIAKSDFTSSGVPLEEQEFDRMQEQDPGARIVFHFLDPEKRAGDQVVLDKSILYPGGVIASDGGLWTTTDQVLIDQLAWPLPLDAVSHPRSAGTHAKFLRIYVREREAIPLIEAIAKLSYYPARILENSVPQMKAKGRIQASADADVIVFNLSTVSDRATFQRPARTSVGIEHVIVAGTPLVVNGQMNAAVLPGRPVRREIKLAK